VADKKDGSSKAIVKVDKNAIEEKEKKEKGKEQVVKKIDKNAK